MTEFRETLRTIGYVKSLQGTFVLSVLRGGQNLKTGYP